MMQVENMKPVNRTYGGSRTIDLIVLVMTGVFFSNLLLTPEPAADVTIHAYPVVTCPDCAATPAP